MGRIVILLLLIACWPAAAQIYKTTDEQGNVVYTDTPPASGGTTEQIQLSPTNTSAPPPEIARPDPPLKEEKPAEAGYTVEIASPANETTIAMGPGNFLLSVRLDPDLKTGELLQLHVDGTAWGEPQNSASWALTNVFRGEHKLTVSVLDAEGTPLVTSAPILVYVLRPSINYRNRN